MSTRPGDDELPPDPFPGDPFAAGQAPTTPPPPPDGASNPLAGLFAQFAQSTAGQGPLNVDLARHLAIWTAAGATVEASLEPIERIRVETIATRALPLVEEVTGLSFPGPSKPSPAGGATRAEWAAETLTAWRPVLDGLAGGVSAAFTPDPDDTDDDLAQQLQALGLGAFPGGFAGLAKMIAPTVAAMQAGTLLGQLATTALGSYDLVVPRAPTARVLLVSRAVAEFSESWSLPADHAATQIIARDLVSHTILGVPHIGERIKKLTIAHASAGQLDPSGLGDMGGLTAMLGGGLGGLLGQPPGGPSPAAMLAGEPTAEQLRLRAQLRLVIVPVLGAIDYLSSAIGARLLGDNRQVVEALRRRRLDRDNGTRLVEHLLGVGVDQAGLDDGRTFIGGVVERAGHDGLLALFSEPDRLPTETELAAPGLWLARIGLAD
jgi:putative hydrolase